jgi:ATP-dependent helicase/nuclease subunit A
VGLEGGERRLANVHKLLRLARRFEAGEGRDLRAFLDHVAHLMSTAGTAESDAPVEGVEPDTVRLMSIHAAKGLEFGVVCVADLGRAQNTRLADLLVDGPRIGLQLVRLDGGKATPALDYEQLAAERRAAEAEEEDRILYVAMTRARERLLLSGAVDFARWPEARPGATAISLLGPALSQELPTLVQAPGESVRDLAVGRAGTATVRLRLNTRASLESTLRRDPLTSAAPIQPVAQPAGSLPAGTVVSARSAPPDREQPAEAPKHISSLSYTSLTELERCGYRYYLERVLGLGEDRTAARSLGARHGVQARARGILIHRLLESLDFARPAPPSAERVDAAARELGTSLQLGESAQIAELLSVACGAAPAARLARAEDVRREHPFAFSLGPLEPLVTGVIDVLAQEPGGGYLVLDYKSDRVGATDDLSALVEREYGVQRLLYALAVLREGAPSVEIVHWFLERPNERIAVTYGAAERETLQRELSIRLAAARGRGFAVAERPHRGLCLTCPGRASLCSWGEEETLREEPAGREEPTEDS